MQLSIFQYISLAPIRFYKRFISRLKPAPSCRFHPTCSHYAEEAIVLHGVIKGSYLATSRVLRCHPFNPGGFDPVPLKKGTQELVEES